MCVKLLVFQLLYQEMRKTYNAQKKPLDKMKEKVKQLLEVLEDSIEEPNPRPRKRQKTLSQNKD